MCLHINKNRHPEYKPRIAGYNIIAYKAFDSNGYSNLISPYQRTMWKENELVKVEMRGYYGDAIGKYLFPEESVTTVYRGLHAALTHSEAGRHGFNIRRVIIPKGSEFYISDCDKEIVANQMIVLARNHGLMISKANYSKHKVKE